MSNIAVAWVRLKQKINIFILQTVCSRDKTCSCKAQKIICFKFIYKPFNCKPGVIFFFISILKRQYLYPT